MKVLIDEKGVVIVISEYAEPYKNGYYIDGLLYAFPNQQIIDIADDEIPEIGRHKYENGEFVLNPNWTEEDEVM